MGKKLMVLWVLAGMLLAGRSAQADSKTITVTAVVPDKAMSLTAVIRSFTDGNPDGDPWTNSSEVTTMNFGTLTNLLTDGTNAGVFYSSTGFCVVLFASAYGKPYQITSTCSGLSGASTGSTIPSGGFGIVPVYSKDDKFDSTSTTTQGTMPTGATLGSSGTAIATDKLVYSSETGTATDHIIQVYYGLSPKNSDGSSPFTGWTGIPLTQKADTYSGSVVITIAAKS